MPNSLNIRIVQGTTEYLVFNLDDAQGADFDLTGYSVDFKVTLSRRHPTQVMLATKGNGKVSTVDLTGKVTVTIDPADTSDEVYPGDSRDCFYQLILTSPTSEIFVPFEGTFTITKSIV